MHLVNALRISSFFLLVAGQICAENLPGPVAQSAGQRYVCNIGYTAGECAIQQASLRRLLSRYHAERLGEWTWVIVKTRDWQEILATRQMNPDLPAFTYLQKRQTFFDEALFTTVPGRSATLLRSWGIALDRLLEVTVTHELAHAFCAELDEHRTEESAGVLRTTGAVVCTPGKPDRSKVRLLSKDSGPASAPSTGGR